MESSSGHRDVAEALSARKWRFRWGHWLPWKKVETAPWIRELIGSGFTVFHLSQLLASTNNFARACKIGSYNGDDYYKGQLHDGLDIMIKISSHQYNRDSSLGIENEVRFLAKLQHKNIVKLIGCCIERGEKLLVYEYMANGWLVDAITGTRTRVLPNWSERFKIIIGMAHGLVYLHEYCGMRIMHRDLKPHNILLDSDMTPKIAGFAISHTYDPDGTRPLAGTVGYMDPEYIIDGIYSEKSDVYSFGITLLEIIAGKRYRALFTDEDDGNRLQLLRSWTTGRAMELIDPVLHDEPRMAEIMRCIQIAVLCAEPNGEDRPTMWDVLLMLRCESMTLPVPKQPESRYSIQNACEGELSDSDNIEPR